MQTTCSTVFLLITHYQLASGGSHSLDMAGAEDSVVQIASWGWCKLKMIVYSKARAEGDLHREEGGAWDG